MSQTAHPDTSTAIAQASQLNAFELFLEASRRYPARIALTDRERSFSYAETRTRVLALSEAFRTRGIRAGDRIAVLSQNCIEYIETHLAAARIGAIVACQNWRLQASELAHCVSLVEPALLLHSARFDAEAAELAARQQIPHCSWEALSDRGHDGREDVDKEDAASPESGLLILYTSGTTGPAKAAVISQRAIIARMMLLRIDLDIDDEDGFVAWAPMFHMGGSEHSVSTLMMGGTVFVADGFDEHYIAEIVGKQRLGWLLLVPATIERLLAAMDANGIEARGIKRVGAMADLLPKKQIVELSARMRSPFLNTFGATETGIAPASRGTIGPGEFPDTLAKSLSSLCALRLVDGDGADVADGDVGEAAVRGPTLFSGYWNNPSANARDFRDGWFRMGDLFRRNADGTLDFCGRAKYLIKSGGENIYPAEIEAVLLADSRVKDAIVVSQRDEKWGEVPVAVLASTVDDTEDLEAELRSACRDQLAGYKCPRAFVFIEFDDLPRSSSGKIVRQDVEDWLRARQADAPD